MKLWWFEGYCFIDIQMNFDFVGVYNQFECIFVVSWSSWLEIRDLFAFP
jgi:hypothetical protein